MESKYKNINSLTLQECEKLTTPFSINDILTKENEAKCNFENGFPDSFGGKIGYGKSVFKNKEAMEKDLKYYDDCNGFRDYTDDGALDMSRKNHYPVTELSG